MRKPRTRAPQICAVLAGVASMWTFGGAACAADTDADALAKQVANPVAALISVPFQLNWDTGLAGNGLGEKWLLNVQPVVPLVLNENWNLITRTIIPLEAESDIVPGDSHVSGLGDISESMFFTPRQPLLGGWIVGVGPELVLPTATESALGNGKLGLGPTVIALRQTPGAWTFGALVGHVWSVAGSSSRPALSATSLQPFLSRGLGHGITLGANLEASYDWEGSHWVVPLNLSVSKVVKLGNQLLSVGGGVRYYLEAPAGGPDWGLRLTFTLLFPK